MSVLPYPPLHTKSKFVVLSDWDGTITDRDSNDCVIDGLGFGYEKRRALNLEVLAGRMSFRDSFAEMLDSVNVSFDELKAYVQKHVGMDPGFKDFYEWCLSKDIPVIIVSSGMEPNILALLATLLTPAEAEQIEIIANDVEYTDPEKTGKTWRIVFRHPESGYGHDKSLAILPYRDLEHSPTLFFCGDGVSDMSAAKHADLLFTKIMANGDSDLMVYCKKEHIPHVPFKDFNDVRKYVEEVVEGRSVRDVYLETGNEL